eukprot:403349352
MKGVSSQSSQSSKHQQNQSNTRLQSNVGFNQRKPSQPVKQNSFSDRDLEQYQVSNSAFQNMRDGEREYNQNKSSYRYQQKNDQSSLNHSSISGNRGTGPQYQNYQLNEFNRDAQNSALTSLGGLQTISQPSVSNTRDQTHYAPLEGQTSNYNNSFKNRKQEDQRSQNRSYRDTSAGGTTLSQIGLNNYLNTLNNNQTYRQTENMSEVQVRPKANRGRSLLTGDFNSANVHQRTRQAETSPSQSNYSNNQNKPDGFLSPKTFIKERQQIHQNLESEPMILSSQKEEMNIDMQEVLLSLHNKMKSLENKYIDLANFYKIEAIKNKQQLTQLNNQSASKSPQRSYGGTGSHFYQQNISNRRNSPLRFSNQNEIVQAELDVVQEQNIISDLLNEKTQLDRELENITINKFENEFIKYINENYNSFTEKDIMGLFSNLKSEIISIVQDNLKQLGLQTQKDSFRPSHNFNQDSQSILNQASKLFSQYKKDQSEFEINQEYTMQKLKKNVFDLQNHQDLSALDLKKASMLIQNLAKSSQDLCQATQKQKDLARNMLNNKNTSVMASPRSLALTQDQIATDIQGQVKLIQSTFTQINNKVHGQSSVLKNLTSVQDEFQSNLNTLKKNYRDSQADKQSLNYNQELDELQMINMQLQDELRSNQDRLRLLQLDNQSLQDQLSNFQKQRDRSPISLQNQRITRNLNNDSIDPMNNNYSSINNNTRERDLSKINDYNRSLEQRISSMTRSMEEKDREIQKLGRDLNMEYATGQQQKLKNLLAKTQKFLVSMKKLQKAVHQKQPNVSREKQDFEDNRKDLEGLIKQYRRDIDENYRIQPRGSGNSPVKNNFTDNRNLTQPDTQPRIEQRSFMNIHGQQNQSHSIYKRNNQQHQHQISTLPHNEQNSMMTAINPVSDLSYQRDKSPIMLRHRGDRGPMTGNGVQREMFKSIETHDRNRAHNLLLTSLSAERQPQQRSPSVGERLYGAHQNSGIPNPFTINRLQSPSQQQQQKATLHQSHDIEVLLQQIRDLKVERENTNLRLMKTERDKDSYNVQRQQIEQEMERMRRILEQQREEIRDILEEKIQLKDELDRLLMVPHVDNNNLQPLLSPSSNRFGGSTNSNNATYVFELEQRVRKLEKELKDTLDKSERLFEQVQLNDRINQEFKRTIQILEDSVESGRRTINDQKELIQQKESKIWSYKSKLKSVKIVKDSNVVNSNVELKQIQSQLEDQIEQTENSLKSKIEELNKQVDIKSQDIAKLKRQIERTIKEQEIQKINLQQEKNEPNHEDIVSNLKQQIQGFDLEIQKLKSEQTLKAQESSQLQQDKEGLEEQIKDIKEELQSQETSHQTAIDSLNHDKQLFQSQLSQLKKLKDLEVQQLQQQLTDKEDLLKVIEADKQELVEQIEELKQLHESQNNTQQDLSQKNQVIKQLESQIKQLQNQIESLKQKYKQEIEALQEQNQQDLEGLEAMNIEEQNALKQDHKQELQKLQQQHKLDLSQYVNQQSQILNQQLQLKEEQHQIDIEEKIKEIKDMLMTDQQKALQKQKEKSDSEKNKIREMLESKFQAQLTEMAQNSDQVDMLTQLHENQKTQCQQEKLILQQQIKDEQAKAKKSLQGKQQELEIIKQQNQLEIDRLERERQEVEEQIEQLNKEKDQSIKFINEKNKAKCQEYEQFIKRKESEIKQLQSQNQEIQGELSEVKQSIQQLEEDKTQLQSNLNIRDQDIKKLHSEIKIQAQQQQQLLQQKESEIEELQETINQLECQISQSQNHLSTQEQQLKAHIEQLKQQQIDKNQKLQEQEQSVFQLNSKLMKIQQDLSDKDDELNLQEQKLEQMQKSQDQIKNKLIETQDELKSQKVSSNEQIEQLNLQITQLEQDLEEQLVNSEDYKNQLEQTQSEMEALQKQQNVLQNDHNTLERNHENVKKERDQYKNDLLLTGQSVNDQVAQKDEEIQQLRAESQQEKQTHQKSEDAIKELQHKLKQSENTIKEQQIAQQQLDGQIQNLEQQIIELQNEEQDTQQLLDDEKQAKDELQDKAQQLQNQLEQTQLELQQSKELLQQKTEQVQNLQTQISELSNESNMTKILKANLQQQIDQAQTQKNDHEKIALQYQQQLQQQIQDKENENQELQQQIDDLQTQIQQLQEQIQETQRQLQEQQEINQKYQGLQEQMKEFEEQNNELTEQINQYDLQFEQQNHVIQELEEQSNQLQNELTKANQELDTQLQSLSEKNKQELNILTKQHNDIISKKDQQVNSLMNEKERIQDQLKDIINQNNYQKESLEAQLQSQLNQTLEKLQLKERENQELINKVQQAESQISQLEQAMEEYQQKLNSQQEEVEQLQVDFEERTELEREKYNQTLESNRNIIQMLKTELQKALDQHKIGETQKSSQKNEDQQVLQDLHQQIQNLQSQNLNLRTEFDAKMKEYQQQASDMDQELKGKNELIEECNQVIEEFNDEKHEIKAKFKHLIHLLEHQNDPDYIDESAYKEEDEIDLEQCFERFEREFSKNQKRIESRIEELEKDNSILRQEVQLNREELSQIQIKMAELQAELMNALNKQDQNDLDVRKKLENASKKVQTYKDKIIEKQKVILEMEATMKQLIEMQSRNSDNLESNRSNNQNEKKEWMTKYNYAQQEVQQLKQQIEKMTANKSQQIPQQVDQSTIDRIDQIETQMMQLRKQIFMAKDQVIDQLSDTFAKRIKDIQNTYTQENILRAKLSEMKTTQQFETTLNNNIKLIKAFNFGKKRLLVVQVISNSECYVIDDSKLNETAINYLKQYLPSDEQDLDSTFIHIDETQQKILDKLQDKLVQLRTERSKLQNDLTQIKAKITQGIQIDAKSNLQTLQLEDEVGSLSKEIIEHKLKEQDHKILENHLRSRAIELNEIVKGLSQISDSDSANRKLIKLMEDNESLKQQLISQTKKLRSSSNKMDKQNTMQEEDDLVEEGDFFQGIQVADNLQNRSNNEHDENNMFDQSSIYGVIEGINDEERKSRTQQDIKIKLLEQQVEEFQQKNQTLQNELQRSQQNSIHQGEKAMFDNIKGTLIQFLKNCPLTDKNNEILLDIVFEMMEFSDNQILEINDKRKRGGPRSGSVSHASGTEEEEVKKNVKKGIFGMFKKKEGSTTRKPEESNIVSPIRPIRRM